MSSSRTALTVGFMSLVAFGALCMTYSRFEKISSPGISPVRQYGGKVRKLDHRNFTIVSAYFNLGTFRKGASERRGSENYRNWAKSLTRMHNPLVFYTDDAELKNVIETGRRNFTNVTSVIFLQNKTSLWAFQIEDEIQKIYSNPSYPKYYPSTVSSEYSCIQHAKYELLVDAIDRKLYVADYYAWLDAGYFRSISTQDFHFRLEVPPDFRDNDIAFNQMKKLKPTLPLGAVIRRNKLWVGGGMFIGTAKNLITFSKQYQLAVETFLHLNMTNVDQQMLYAMFTDKGRQVVKPTVEIQGFKPPKGYKSNRWFYLGFLCLKRIAPWKGNATR